MSWFDYIESEAEQARMEERVEQRARLTEPVWEDVTRIKRDVMRVLLNRERDGREEFVTVCTDTTWAAPSSFIALGWFNHSLALKIFIGI